MRTIPRSTGNRRSTHGRASNSTARRSPTGSAGPPGCCSRWASGSRRMSSPASRCTPTTRRCRCSIPAAAAPRKAGCGSMSATTGHAPMSARRRRCSSTRPTRKGERPAEHLARFGGFLQADAYPGFDKLFGERIVEVACWAHARRKIFEVHQSTKSPVAAAALKKIAELYRIEMTIRGRPPDLRREVRQERTKPLLTALHGWLTAQLGRLPPKGGLAEAFRYALGNWTALTRFVDDGRLEIDNNRAENTIRG